MTSYVSPPVGQDIGDFLGRGDDAPFISLAGEHLPIVIAMVRGYTRGAGFDGTGNVTEDLAAVITTATARLATNPEGVRQYSLADYSESRAVFQGWTLAETFVLNRYRKRAA